MFNFNFIKAQIKLVLIPVIVAFVVFLVFIAMTLMESSFAPNNDINGSGSNVESPFNTIFIFPSIIIFFGLIIFLIYQVIIREISKGYFTSWLTTPMARRTTLNSKFLVIITALLALNILLLVLHLVLFAAVYRDFNSSNALHVFYYYLSLAFVTVLATAISWVIITYFLNNTVRAISLACMVLILFFVFFVINFIGKEMPTLAFLKHVKYFTILSFLKPLAFESLPKSVSEPNSIVYAKNVSLGWSLFWQIPLMLLLISGCMVGGNYLFYKKDLHL